jgi:hypothetical protein
MTPPTSSPIPVNSKLNHRRNEDSQKIQGNTNCKNVQREMLIHPSRTFTASINPSSQPREDTIITSTNSQLKKRKLN